MQLILNFFNHSILVTSNEASLIEKLKEEFHYFEAEVSLPEKTVLHLAFSAPDPIPAMTAVKILEEAIIYHQGSLQYIDYSGEALTLWDTAHKNIRISSLNPDRLFELAFLAIHSHAGQALDRSGYCRVHALGVSFKKRNALIMLPSKGGKSTLLQHLFEIPGIKIISDDIPLIDKEGRVHAFPSKISLSEKPQSGILSTLKWHEFKRKHFPPKWMASLSQQSSLIEHHAENNSTLLIAGFRLSSGPSRLMRVNSFKMIKPLLEHMILGFGLPQILELFLTFRPKDAVKLIQHALLRSRSSINLVLKSECYHFYMGPDKTKNAQMIMDVLNVP